MPVERPTLTDLITRIVGDIDTRLPELFVAIQQNPANVFATSVAGLSHGIYGYIDSQMFQVLPTHATGVNLENWAKLTNTPRRPATKATVPVSVAVTTIPTTIPSGTTVRRSDGTLYATTEELSATSNPFAFEVTSLEEGAATTVISGATLTLTTYISGIGSTVTATATGEGEDIEDIETWRGRILDVFRQRAQGGADADYVKWAKEVPGVGYAWVIPSIPPYVDLRITSNDEDDLEASPELIDTVQAYIEDVPDKRKKPVNAVLLTDSATVTPQDFEFDVFEPNTASVKTAVETALAQLLGTADIRKPGSKLQRNAIIASVQNTGVVTEFNLLSPATDVQYGTVEFPSLGEVVVP